MPSNNDIERKIALNIETVYKKSDAIDKLKLDMKSIKIDNIADKQIKDLEVRMLKLAKSVRLAKNRVHKYKIELQKAKQAQKDAADKANKLGKTFSKVAKFAQIGQKAVVGFNGAALSMMFFGMALQRVFIGALSSIYEGYKKAMPQASEFNRQTTALSANWEFFKFQLADAFAKSDLFQRFISLGISLLQTFQRLPQPVKELVVDFGIMMAVLGTLAVAYGTLSLGVGALIDTFHGLKVAISSIKLSSFLAGGPLALGIAAIVAALGLAVVSWNKFSDSSDYAKKKSSLFKDTLMDTVKSAFKPLMDAFKDIGVDINDFNDFLVVAGAVVQDIILFIGMLIDEIISFGRIMSNIMQMALNPFIRALKTYAKIIMYITTGKWAKAWKEGSNYLTNVKKDMVTDINDIVDAWDVASRNIEKKQQAFVNPKTALDEYHKQMAEATATTNVDLAPSPIQDTVTQSPSQVVNNIFMVKDTQDMVDAAPKEAKSVFNTILPTNV